MTEYTSAPSETREIRRTRAVEPWCGRIGRLGYDAQGADDRSDGERRRSRRRPARHDHALEHDAGGEQPEDRRDAPATPAQVPTAFARCADGNVEVIVDKVAGMTSAAPRPRTAAHDDQPRGVGCASSRRPSRHRRRPGRRAAPCAVRSGRRWRRRGGAERRTPARRRRRSRTARSATAWVSRAMDGMATFSDATAETTVASASMMTGNVARRTRASPRSRTTVDMVNLLGMGRCGWSRSRRRLDVRRVAAGAGVVG